MNVEFLIAQEPPGDSIYLRRYVVVQRQKLNGNICRRVDTLLVMEIVSSLCHTDSLF